jgi:hypothetical protein
VSGDNAFTFQPASVDSFREKMVELASRPAPAHAASVRRAREYALQGYDFVAIAKQYTEVLRTAVEKWNHGKGAAV